MAKIEDLQKLNNDLDQYLQMERMRKANQEDKILMTKLIGEELVALNKPVLDAFDRGVEMNRETIQSFNNNLEEQKNILTKGIDGLAQTIKDIKIEVPPISVPSVNLPKIEVPNVNVVVDTKDINKTITEAFKGLKTPTINVPKPEVTVNVPKIPKLEWPKEKMSIEGWVRLMGVDLQNPLPVQLRDASGKPVDLNLYNQTISSGGKADFFTIKGFAQSAFAGLTDKDGNLKISGSVNTEVIFYATQLAVDSGDATITYVGKAEAGTLLAAAAWQIKRITDTSGDLSIEFANGDANFDNVWNNREALVYS